jgi:hypothetical protein
MPASVGTSGVSGFFPPTPGTQRRLTYHLPTPEISSGGQSTLSSPLIDISFPSAAILIVVGHVQASYISLTGGEPSAEDFNVVSGPVTPVDLAMAAWATGTGIHGRELRPEFEDED